MAVCVWLCVVLIDFEKTLFTPLSSSPDINPFIGHTGVSEIQLLIILIFKELRSSQLLDLCATIL